MINRFLKLNLDNDEGDFLASRHPNAFVLLYLIARRARRKNGLPDGLIIGDALIASTDLEPGISRQNFRTALNKLIELGYIEIVSNGKSFFKRQKSTIKITIKSMLVNLLKSTIYDINPEPDNQHINQQLTNSQPTANHKQERIIKKNKEEDHPSIPSVGDGLDDFSSTREKEETEKAIEIIPNVFLTSEDLAECIRLKGSIEKVREAIEFIQGNDRREYEITSWPNALATWKIDKNKNSKNLFQENTWYAQTVCNEFQDFSDGQGWRCSMHHDRVKDQKGLLFEHVSPYHESFFVSLIDGEFQRKCESFIHEKHMTRKIIE